MTALAPLLQAFFTDRLIAQRRASSHTIARSRNCRRQRVIRSDQLFGDAGQDTQRVSHLTVFAVSAGTTKACCRGS